jgi:hypothetical protein
MAGIATAGGMARLAYRLMRADNSIKPKPLRGTFNSGSKPHTGMA